MKKAIKILRIVLLVVLVLIIAIAVLIKVFGNSALKAGIKTAASSTLKVGVDINDINFSILGGSVEFQGLVIDNPPGYFRKMCDNPEFIAEYRGRTPAAYEREPDEPDPAEKAEVAGMFGGIDPKLRRGRV